LHSVSKRDTSYSQAPAGIGRLEEWSQTRIRPHRIDMKPDIHPDYRPVVFQDSSSDFKFLTRSTIKANETIVWEDGNTYPLVKLEVTSASHPFYTGKKSTVRATGQVEKFNKRFKKA
jgi:large subunit ribosomal protein L31